MEIAIPGSLPRRAVRVWWCGGVPVDTLLRSNGLQALRDENGANSRLLFSRRHWHVLGNLHFRGERRILDKTLFRVDFMRRDLCFGSR